MRSRRLCVILLSLLAVASQRFSTAADGKILGPADPDFKVQGEYTGAATGPDGGPEIKVGVQVIALGGGKFHAVAYHGGLPGDGWDGGNKFEVDGQRQDGVVVFPNDQGRGEIKNGVLRIHAPAGEVLAELAKVERKSPTLGAPPPPGAVVLFDGKSGAQFNPGTLTTEGNLAAGATSKRKFGSCQLHVEFLLPFMPEARGQDRGNSGCYLQGRYEVQMLDSFGLTGENDECGGIYGVKSPDTNMAFPPLSWQTYDIDYTAARYENGKKVKNATITVMHNGVVVQKNVEVPNATRAAPVPEGPEPGPLYLQEHGNAVCYRNVWLVEKP
jgi:hypothetical protein